MVSGIQGTSSLSSDMMAQMKEKMFARLDPDGDGQISLADLAAEMEAKSSESSDEVSGRSDPFADLYEQLTAADVDGDGMVSAEEFDAMELPPPPPGPPPDGEFSEESMSLYSADATEATEYDLLGTLIDQLG